MELMKRTGLEDQLKKKAGKYSRGMRQRLGLADVQKSTVNPFSLLSQRISSINS